MQFRTGIPEESRIYQTKATVLSLLESGDQTDSDNQSYSFIISGANTAAAIQVPLRPMSISAITSAGNNELALRLISPRGFLHFWRRGDGVGAASATQALEVE